MLLAGAAPTPSDARRKKPHRPHYTARSIRVVASRLLYLPPSSDFATTTARHRATVLLFNRARAVAQEVRGQVSIYAPNGRLVKSYNPNSIYIAPRSFGIWSTSVDLPAPMDGAQMKARVTVNAFLRRSWPFSVRSPQYALGGPDDFSPCRVTGILSNRLTRPFEPFGFSVTAATFDQGRLVSSAIDYIDTIIPRVPQTFEADFDNSVECPFGATVKAVASP